MNNDVRGEMIVVLNSEEIDPDQQIIILGTASKFLNNVKYVQQIKDKLDIFFVEGFNFWVELPKIISVIIEFNKNVFNNNDISKKHMKYVLYVVLYNYLNESQPNVLNNLDQGDFRIGLLNILLILMFKPTNVKVLKQSFGKMLLNCICDDDKIHL